MLKKNLPIYKLILYNKINNLVIQTIVFTKIEEALNALNFYNSTLNLKCEIIVDNN